jgi:hypothetical protein
MAKYFFGQDSKLRVDRAARTIFGVSMAVVGKANGDVFDDETLRLLSMHGAAFPVRSRFDHGEEGWTGKVEQTLDKLLGTYTNYRIDGDRLRADVQFLGINVEKEDKVMDFAEKCPQMFGLSVVFNDETVPKDKKKKGAPCRPVDLLAADFVDLPAANPTGLFAAKTAEGNEMDPADVYAKDGKLFCMMEGKEVELNHTQEAVDNLMDKEKEKKKAEKDKAEPEPEPKPEPKKMGLESEKAMTPEEIEALKAQAKKDALAEERTYAKMFGTVLSTTGLKGEAAEKFQAQFYDRHLSEDDLKFFAQSIIRERTQPAGEGGAPIDTDKEKDDEDPDKDVVEAATKRFSTSATTRGIMKVISSDPNSPDYKEGLAKYVRLSKKNKHDRNVVLASKKISDEEDTITRAIKKFGVMVD